MTSGQIDSVEHPRGIFSPSEEEQGGKKIQAAERLLEGIPRAFAAGDQGRLIPFIEVSLDWDYFEDQLKKRSLALIFFGLARNSPQISPALPARLMDWLRLNYYVALEESVHRDLALEEILSSFHRASIPLIVLRGAALARLDYPDPALRTSSDIDIVVRRADLSRAHSACHSMGFEMKTEHGEMVYCRESPSRVHLDIHWELWYAKEAEIWRNARPVEIGGFPCFVLAPEDNALHLIAHAMIHHGRFSLQDAVDLALVIRNNSNLDWRRIESQIKGTALRDCTWFAVSQTRAWTGLDIPQNVLDRLKPRFLFSWRSRLLKKCIAAYNRPDVGHFLRPLACRGGSSKIAFLFRFFFPAPEFMKRRYDIPNSALLLIYYFLRPFLLLQKMVRYWKS